jgi:hypothetical protein
MNPFRQINDAHWSVQPLWLKRLIVALVVPAWLSLGFGIVTGRLNERVIEVAAAIMIAAALISTTFIVAAYWRNEI